MAGFNQTLKWTFGLLNSSKYYLTAETFQSKVVCNGKTMKKKQIWTLERISETTVALKASTGRYLTAESGGELNGSGESVGDNQKFEFANTQPDGKIAIKSVTHSRYIGGSGDMLTCYTTEKDLSPLNFFTIHLAMHPQINLRNSNRKTYCHLDSDAGEIRCNEEIPWGLDAMLILEFHDGKYALRAANTKYLSRTGVLQDRSSAETMFTLVFRGTLVAFRDSGGKYLTAVGASGKVMARKDTIGKDELFVLEDSHPQVQLKASNGKYVSIKDRQEEVHANQSTVEDTEIFQMEAVDRTDRSGNVKWAFRSNNKLYWNSEKTIQSNQKDFAADSAQFAVEWLGTHIAVRASNGKYVSVKPNGTMCANSSEVTEECRFLFEFINRPILILRGCYGFVGVKGASSILECNRSQYDVFGVANNSGAYQLAGANGKFWTVDAPDNTLSCTSDTPVDFKIELRAHTHMVIIAPNGHYLKGAQNGGFTATGGTSVDSNTLWEY